MSGNNINTNTEPPTSKRATLLLRASTILFVPSFRPIGLPVVAITSARVAGRVYSVSARSFVNVNVAKPNVPSIAAAATAAAAAAATGTTSALGGIKIEVSACHNASVLHSASVRRRSTVWLRVRVRVRAGAWGRQITASFAVSVAWFATVRVPVVFAYCGGSPAVPEAVARFAIARTMIAVTAAVGTAAARAVSASAVAAAAHQTALIAAATTVAAPANTLSTARSVPAAVVCSWRSLADAGCIAGGGVIALTLMVVVGMLLGVAAGTAAALAVSVSALFYQTALIAAATTVTATASTLSAATTVIATASTLSAATTVIATASTLSAATAVTATASTLSAACRVPAAVILASLHNHTTAKRKGAGSGSPNRFVG